MNFDCKECKTDYENILGYLKELKDIKSRKSEKTCYYCGNDLSLCSEQTIDNVNSITKESGIVTYLTCNKCGASVKYERYCEYDNRCDD